MIVSLFKQNNTNFSFGNLHRHKRSESPPFKTENMSKSSAGLSHTQILEPKCHYMEIWKILLSALRILCLLIFL